MDRQANGPKYDAEQYARGMTPSKLYYFNKGKVLQRLYSARAKHELERKKEEDPNQHLVRDDLLLVN